MKASVKRLFCFSSKRIAVWLILGALVASTGTGQASWQLAWSDEFTQADGSSPDPVKWGYDIGNGGWGNNEQEYYTSRTNNARIEGGQLVIEARQESYGGSSYTSARLLTRGKWSGTYGRMEARLKIPRGQGLWPAFWMLGTNIDSVGWPTCGEIDIMENIGREPTLVHGTIHGPGYSGGNGIGGPCSLANNAVFADDFHIYAIEWTPNQLKWFVDGQQFFVATPANLPQGTTWVFTQPQFLILNVAVGGNWPGYPDATTTFPQRMTVDYVRFYSYVPAPPTAPTGLKASPGSAKVYLSWDASTSGATGYNVKRSTSSGGSYTTIASPTNTSYTDTGLSSCATYYYVVSATNTAGQSTDSGERAAALGAFALALNSGGSAAGQFTADANFSGGTQAAPTSSVIDTSSVVAPAPQAVYQSERYGNFTYTFTGLTSGVSYKVRLHFAEYYWTAVGQRKFNVSINGTQVLTNFDIIAAVGSLNKAAIQEFTVNPSGGQILIQYTTVTDNAKSSGIEILLLQPGAPVGLTATAGNSQVALNWNPVAGASYTVSRGLSGVGPYTSVATGLTSPNHTDAGLTNNTPYYYVVSASIAGCESTNSATVSATPACSTPAAPVAGHNGPIWTGMTLSLTASTVPGAAYSWSGPNGFVSTSQNPSISNATTNASGLYSVTAVVGSCASSPGTTNVIVNPPAKLAVQFSAGEAILSWPGGTLQSATNVSGPWGDVFGATSPHTNPTAAPQEFYRLRLP